MTAPLFVARPTPTELRIALYLLPEERLTLYRLLQRLQRVAPAEKKIWLGGLVGAFAPRRGNQKVTLRLTVRRAVWLAEFLGFRLGRITHDGERRALDAFRGALTHNLAFRCALVVPPLPHERRHA